MTGSSIVRRGLLLVVVLGLVAACGKKKGGGAPGGADGMDPSMKAPPALAGPMKAAAAMGASGATASAAGATASAAGATEYWRVRIPVPAGLTLEVGVTLTRDAKTGAYGGRADIPMQNLFGAPLRAVKRDKGSLGFTLELEGRPKAAWPVFSIKLAPGGKAGRGTMVQGRANLSCRAARVVSAKDLPQKWRRPQTPKPPFPYQAIPVMVTHLAEKCTFAGTLTMPTGKGPHPAVLLITGSGMQDRDETIFGHKPFFVIADYLTRRGFAVLRVDDRSRGKTTCPAKGTTIQRHVEDVEVELAWLRKHKGIDPRRVGLIGHSEGGILASIVAAKRKDVAFVVNLAGTAIVGARLSAMQMRAIAKASHPALTAPQLQEVYDRQLRITKLVASGADAKKVTAQVETEVAALTKLIPDPDEKGATPAQLAGKIAAQVRLLLTPWFRSFLALDPAVYLRRVKTPMLILIGEKDTQVPAGPNLAAFRAALTKAGNQAFTALALPGLNHLFQPAKKGTLAEYAQIEVTFDEATLKRIADWLRARAFPK